MKLKTQADGCLFPTTDSSQTIIDCFLTGGFNFQAAWTTGWLAGRAMAAAVGPGTDQSGSRLLAPRSGQRKSVLTGLYRQLTAIRSAPSAGETLGTKPTGEPSNPQLEPPQSRSEHLELLSWRGIGV